MEKLLKKHWEITAKEPKLNFSDAHANLTTDIAIGFNNWVYINRYRKSDVRGNEHLWYDTKNNYAKYLTEHELFTIYIEQL